MNSKGEIAVDPGTLAQNGALMRSASAQLDQARGNLGQCTSLVEGAIGFANAASSFGQVVSEYQSAIQLLAQAFAEMATAFDQAQAEYGTADHIVMERFFFGG